MLNKKKVAAVIAIPVIIILAIIIFMVAKNSGGPKVAKLYDELESSQAYLFEMKDTGGYEITIAKKDGKMYFDTSSGDEERTTTIVKDDAAYVIIHSQKEYIIYDKNIVGETIVTDMLKDLENPDNIGKENVYGKNYKYEEYIGFAGFMTSTNMDVDENNVKTRFYFSGNNLEYIKTIIEGSDDDLLQINISYTVPDELFEIPSDYAEANY